MLTPRWSSTARCYTAALIAGLHLSLVFSFSHHPISITPSTDARDASQQLLIPPNVIGPPEPLRSLRTGEHIDAFRSLQYEGIQCNNNSEILEFSIERVSSKPDIFCLRNFVTQAECEQIQSLAKETDQSRAETVTKNDTSSRTNCSVAWIPSNGARKFNLVSDLVSSTANIFLSKDVLSHPSAGVEDLQVLEYEVGGEFVYHHDGIPRILTVIYYLNGVGGTWFPLACAESEEITTQLTEPRNKAHALELVKDLAPGRDGLLVKGTGNKRNESNQRECTSNTVWIGQGDALAFYNYLDDGSARVDWRSLHCGLQTTNEDGTKWIANHWYRLNSLLE